MFLRIALLIAPLTVVGLILASAIVPHATRPAYACSGGSSALEWYVDRTEYVVIVEPVSVGGPENTAPTLAPPATLFPAPPITATPGSFDLTGIGATLGVIESLLGIAPSQFDIDEPGREQTENQLRQMEADPGFIHPCPPGFLVPRYEANQRYLVVAGYWEGDDRLQTLLKYVVEGDNVLIGGSNDDYGWQLLMTKPARNAYFPDFPFESFGEDESGVEVGRIVADAVPLTQFRAAVQGLFSAEPTPPPSPTSTPAAPASAGTGPIFTPPDTGDAGLR